MTVQPQRRDAATLVVTGHFPPQPGGVQTFAYEFCRRLDRPVVVLAPEHPEAAAFDAAQPFAVHRYTGSLRPSSDLEQLIRTLVRDHDVDSAWITAAAPYGVLGPLLRRVGITTVVGSSHGQEAAAWVRFPVTRQGFRHLTASMDTLTYLGAYTHRRLAPAVRRRTRLAHLPGGVDPALFRPDAPGELVRRRHRLAADQPVVVSHSRLVARKGHDVLLRAWPRVLEQVSDAALLIVGDGPMRPALERAASELDRPESVRFTGAVSARDLPAHLAAGDVYTLPCRNRFVGLEVEGLGLAVLEASASGLPVVVGRSGGTPDTVVEGETGTLVDGRSPEQLAAALGWLLRHPAEARRMGTAGRAWVSEHWAWERLAERLDLLLDNAPLDDGVLADQLAPVGASASVAG